MEKIKIIKIMVIKIIVTTLIEQLLCANHSAEYLLRIISYPHGKYLGQILSAPIYIWESWGSEGQVTSPSSHSENNSLYTALKY